MKRARRKHRFVATPSTQRHPATVAARLPKPRNPVARSPLLGKGGTHEKSRGALRRRARMELAKLASDDATE